MIRECVAKIDRSCIVPWATGDAGRRLRRSLTASALKNEK